MSIYYDKDAKGWKYHFQYQRKNYKSKKYKTRKQAEMAERRKRLELNGNIITLSKLVQMRLDAYEFQGQMQTRAKMEQLYRCRVKPFIEDKDVSLYTPQDILDMAEHLKAEKPINELEKPMKKQSNNSVNTAVKRLGVFFNWGIKRGICSSNPCVNFEKLNYKKPEKVYWTEEEFNNALNNTDPENYKLRTQLELFFWTGVRRSEARALQYQDLNLEKKTMLIKKHIVEDGGHATVPGRKNDSEPMMVLLDDSLVETLKKTKERDQKIDGFNEDWYVLGYKNPFSISTFTRNLDKLSEESGLPRITPHGFRHSHISWLISNTDLSLYEIADRIGDTVQTVQKVYAHLYPDNNIKVVNAINKKKKK